MAEDADPDVAAILILNALKANPASCGPVMEGMGWVTKQHVRHLEECMRRAGLAAFLARDSKPEDVADHLRNVIASYEEPAAEADRLRALVAELEAALSKREGTDR